MRTTSFAIRFFFAALSVAAAASALPAQAPASRITVAGLTGEVTVSRDWRAVPYIEASGDEDLYFVQGFVTASDRLWQMDLMRRSARGELAEIFGAVVLEEDKRWRRFGFGRVAEEGLGKLSPELRRGLEAYARGVNAYIATLTPETMPVEFRILRYQPREWKPSDSLVIGKILADGLSTTWRQDLTRAAMRSLPKEKYEDLVNQVTPEDVVLFGKDAAAVPAGRSSVRGYDAAGLLALTGPDDEVRRRSLERVGFYAEDLAASNNWVISGKRTIDGRPLLANDPHLRSSAPGIWYLAHLSVPGHRVAGVTLPGVPGITLGHNEFIAWGATNVGPDVQDLYREEFNAEGKYRTPGGFEAPVKRTEEIRVRRNLMSPETETQTFEVVETRNGVVIQGDGAERIALRWTARDPGNQEFEAFFRLNRARDWKGFQDALRTYGGPMQNFVFADVKGNIGWYAAGRVPIRRNGDGSVPFDGWTNDGDWTGFIPFEQLPHLYNPPEGFIVTANQRIVGTSYRYFSELARDAATPWRARRIYDLVKANPKSSMNDVRDVQHDVFNIPYSNFARTIVRLGAASPETLAALRGWDGKMTADSAAAPVVHEIRNCVANKIAEANKPAPAALVRERLLRWIIDENSPRWLPSGAGSYADLIRTCDAESRAALSDPKRLGPDASKWRWGNVFSADFQHPLAAAPLIGGQFAVRYTNVNGSGQTPNVGQFVSMRLIASPGNWDETRHVIPLGQSGNPASPHFRDQFEFWRTGNPVLFPFSKEAIGKAAQSSTVFASR